MRSREGMEIFQPDGYVAPLAVFHSSMGVMVKSDDLRGREGPRAGIQVPEEAGSVRLPGLRIR